MFSERIESAICTSSCDTIQTSSEHTIYVDHELQPAEQSQTQTQPQSQWQSYDTTSVEHESHHLSHEHWESEQSASSEQYPSNESHQHEQSHSEHHTHETATYSNESSIKESTNETSLPQAESIIEPIVQASNTPEIPSNDHFVPSSSQIGDHSEASSNDHNDHDQVRNMFAAISNAHKRNKQNDKILFLNKNRTAFIDYTSLPLTKKAILVNSITV